MSIQKQRAAACLSFLCLFVNSAALAGDEGAPGGASRDGATPCVAGFAGSYRCNNVDLLSSLPLAEIGGGEANDIWGWTDPDTGFEYAIIGLTGGTSFISLKDPENPQYLGYLPSHTGGSLWRDMKVYADHAYVVSEASGHGMQVFDLRQLPLAVNPPLTFSETAHYDGFGSAHNIAINEESGYAYGIGTNTCSGGLHFIDLSVPESPQSAGCFSSDGYTHDAQCVDYVGPDPDYQGGEICFAANEDTLTVANVSDKNAPVLVSRTGYDGSGYIHQGWATEDHRYFLLDDEGDESAFGHNTRTYVFDIQDLDAPALIGIYEAPTAAIDHNIYIKDSFAYQANYRAGMRILDLTKVASGVLNENGFFDIYPADDGRAFNGAWSVFPFFDSGVVIVSGIEQGLFVLRPTATATEFRLSASTTPLAVCGAGSDTTELSLEAVGGYQGEVSLSVSGMPTGVSIDFDPPVLAPPGQSAMRIDVEGTAPGIYPLVVTASDGVISFAQTVTVEISNEVPAAVLAALPAGGAVDVSALQPFVWQAAQGAYRYDLEVARDSGFSDLAIALSGITGTSHAPVAALDGDAAYHWRVTARNSCGATVAPGASFAVAAHTCDLFQSTDLPRTISSSGTPVIQSTNTTALSGLIVDVDVVGLRGTHSWIGDLEFALRAPDSGAAEKAQRHPEHRSVTVMERSCGNEDDFDLSLDDEAASGDWPCPPTGGGTWRPSEPLSAFSGASASGEWTLVVTDHVNQDGGQLQAWALSVCTTPVPEAADSDGDGVADSLDNCSAVANLEQRDTDLDGYGNRCDPDLNNDGTVNFLDLGMLGDVLFTPGDQDADLNGDGWVNFLDMAIMKSLFFSPPGPSGTTP